MGVKVYRDSFRFTEQVTVFRVIITSVLWLGPPDWGSESEIVALSKGCPSG